MSATIITIANHKGGVGKTTTAVSLAAGLAELNYRVVLVDCDPQGNVAHFLGLPPGPGLFRLVVQGAKPADVIQRAGRTRLGVIPGDQSTIVLERLLQDPTTGLFDPATALADALQPFRANRRQRYARSIPTSNSTSGRGNQKQAVAPAGQAIIILDTAPSLSSVQLAALNAADWLLIPATPEFAAEAGIGALARAVRDLKELGANLDLLGVLPTMVDRRSNEHRQTIADLHAAFAGLVLPEVRRLIALAEAPRSGLPIWTYAPKSEAALDYAAVLQEVINRVDLT